MVKHFPLPRRLVDRVEYVLAACAGKRVLHVGCAAYASEGDWEATVRSGRWLHGRIAAVARSLAGIDSSEPAVKLLRERHGRTEIQLGSAEALDGFDLSGFDTIVAGELIEHLPSPGLFLSAVAAGMGPQATLVVTTSNAFCVRRLLRVATGAESVHLDHTAYYSHRTLARLGEVCGLRVVDQAGYILPRGSPLLPRAIERCAALVSPNLGEGIVATFSR
ncbi:MAG: class I SAM-dependent methyltransferase [Deltaproteobacteria bacterium]|nr:class I SAM-dependent methyltransferase [Deltaproteobacteria bacterium]